MIDPIDHVMVLSATARLAQGGGWARILAGKPLEDQIDLIDAELLLEAGVLRRHLDQSLEPVHAHPWHYDPDALAAGTLSVLRQALDHAEGRDSGWSGQTLEVMVAQGRASASTATVVGEDLLPRMHGAHTAFSSGRAVFLDVGVGIGAFASRLCELYPGVRAVGLDVEQPVLELAVAHVAAVELSDRIELRHQSIADLTEVDRYDLAWFPQAFIPPAAFDAGLCAVHRALLPNGWMVLLLAAAPSGSDAFQRALQVHGAHLTGGGPVEPLVVAERLRCIGFDQVSEICAGDQSLLLARRPA